MRWGRSDEGDQRGYCAGWDGGVRDRGVCFDRNGDSRCGLKDATTRPGCRGLVQLAAKELIATIDRHPM